MRTSPEVVRPHDMVVMGYLMGRVLRGVYHHRDPTIMVHTIMVPLRDVWVYAYRR